jgi:hypothetical protein
MDNILLNIILAPLAILLYGSGLLLCPIRRWMRRKEKIHGRALLFVFFAQLISYVVVACCSIFIRLEHFYYWFIFLIPLNAVFTLIGIVAGFRDRLYERSKTENPSA